MRDGSNFRAEPPLEKTPPKPPLEMMQASSVAATLDPTPASLHCRGASEETETDGWKSI